MGLARIVNDEKVLKEMNFRKKHFKYVKKMFKGIVDALSEERSNTTFSLETFHKGTWISRQIEKR